MKPGFARSWRQTLVGLLLVTLFCLPALSPLWSLTLPQSYDGFHRLHRLMEFDQAVRHGVLFPRWAPDFVFGYGYPVFNFFPYAHYYLPELLHLSGLSFSQALVAAFLLYTLLSGYSTYLLARDLVGQAPALLAAVVYVYAPYQLHNSLVRGNLPEQFGLALFPLVLWGFLRLGHRGGRQWFVVSALLYAIFLLSHTALDLMLTPVLALYVIGQRPVKWKEVLLSFVLGGGLAAFVLLPAVFERDWVRLSQIWLTLVNFRQTFLSPSQLIALPPRAISHLLHRPDYLALGPVFVILALPAAVTGWWRGLSKELRPWLAITVALLFLSLFLSSPLSVWLWEHLPVLPYLLFPWRFLGVAVFMLALLAGLTFRLLPSGPWRMATLVVALIAVVLTSLPLLYTHVYPERFVSQDLADALAFETRTGLLGGTSYKEYLPIWVEEAPTDSPLLPAYQADQPLEAVERFDVTSLPPGGRVLEAEYGFNRVEIAVSSPQPFRARFHTFYFPGWKATVNGERIEVSPAGPLGLISLDVPAGETQLRLWFGDTPWRTVGKAISLISVGLLLALALRPNLQRATRPAVPPPADWTVRQVMGLGAVALVLLAFKLVYVDRYDSPFRRQGFDGVQVDEAEHGLNVPFGDQLTLLGYSLSAEVLSPGDKANLTLYWGQRQRLRHRPRVGLALINPATGEALPQAPGWVPQDYPLEFWELDWYTRDLYSLVIPADASPGRYALRLALFDEASGEPIGETVTLTRVKVPLPPQDVQPEHPLDLTLGKEIALIGYDLTLLDPPHLTLYWRCLTAPSDDYTVFVHLLDSAGTIVAQADGQPRGGAYPTSIWAPGEIVPDEIPLPLEGLPPADYRLAVGLYQLATAQRLPMIDAAGQRLSDDRLLLPVRWP
jgi:hypothetical protein